MLSKRYHPFPLHRSVYAGETEREDCPKIAMKSLWKTNWGYGWLWLGYWHIIFLQTSKFFFFEVSDSEILFSCYRAKRLWTKDLVGNESFSSPLHTLLKYIVRGNKQYSESDFQFVSLITIIECYPEIVFPRALFLISVPVSLTLIRASVLADHCKLAVYSNTLREHLKHT